MRVLVVGGSDAGISAALQARQVDPTAEVTVLVADAYPNYSICGIPYYLSGDVPDAQQLAHRSVPEIEAAGVQLSLNTTARTVDPVNRRVTATGPDSRQHEYAYDEVILATGAVPARPPIAGLDVLGPEHGVHLLHTVADTFALAAILRHTAPWSALIVGAGYIGLEMAEALTARGLAVTQVEMLPEVLPTVDAELGRLVRARLTDAGVDVVIGARIESISDLSADPRGRLRVTGTGGFRRATDIVLVVVGVRPDTALAASAGVRLGPAGAIVVNEYMRTGVPHVWAAGDCVTTRHQLLDHTYLPLGTTAHKQGRVAGQNAVGGQRAYPGSLGTQVVKVFDLVAARTGLRDADAAAAGYKPHTTTTVSSDHTAYYPNAQPITIRLTGDRATGRLLGVQLVGGLTSEIAKRVDVAAAAIHAGLTVDQISDLDLSYTPPLGTAWDALQVAAQAWQQDTAGQPIPPDRSAVMNGGQA